MTTATATYPTVKLANLTGFVHDDKVKEGWGLLADTPLIGEPTLALAEFLKDGERYVSGEVMVERANALGGVTGQRHAERLLAQQTSIPEEWRKFTLIFPGTLWLHPSGRWVVSYLYGLGGQWSLVFGWFVNNWSSRYRLVRVCE